MRNGKPDKSLRVGSVTSRFAVSEHLEPRRLLSGTVAAQTTYLSDLTPSQIPENGWGSYERDMSNGEQAAGDGGPITLNGEMYRKGLGTHAYSRLVFALQGQYQRFVSAVGVDDYSAGGSVEFQVFADGIQLFDSDVMHSSSQTRFINVPVAGKNELMLVVTDAGDGAGSDHADWAGARLIAGARAQPVTFHMLALIYRNVGGEFASATLDQASVDTITDAVQDEMPTLLNQLAGDQVQMRVHVEVIDRPLDLSSWNGHNYENVNFSDIAPELDQFTRSGWYDHVTVFHGLTSDLGPTAWWGGGGLGRYGMSMSSINMRSGLDKTEDNHAPGWIHEWIHGLEVQYFDFRAISSGVDPQGTPVDLHDASTFGYDSTTEGRPQWSEWYGDFLTDHIKTLQSNGADTGFGLGPDAWALGAPHEELILAPGSPLAFADITKTVVNYLGDTHWTFAATATGLVRRNANANGNAIRINGVQYDRGIGLRANGEIAINLFGRGDRLQSEIGIDDDTAPTAGSARFFVYGDGRLLYQSGVLTGANSASHIDVNIRGARKLRLVVDGTADGTSADHCVWADARVIPTSDTYLSDTQWSSSATDWGVIFLDRTVERDPIFINGVRFPKGVGVHARSDIVVHLNGRFESFESYVGLDDYIEEGAGSVVFKIFGDGQLLWTSPVMTGSSTAAFTRVNIHAVNDLRLHMDDGGDGINGDHGAWAGARFVQRLPTWLNTQSIATWNSDTKTLSVTGPSTIVANPDADVPLISVVGSAAHLIISSTPSHTIDLGSLDLADNARVTVTADTSRLLSIHGGGLAILDGSILDLGISDVIIDYTGASPLVGVANQIRTARNNGTWTGPGITSATARNNPLHNTTLGVIGSADFKSIYGTAALFAGQPIDGTAVLVKYTYYGDTDFNGVVDFDDYSRTDAGFNQGRSGWLNGDVDGNGIIDFDDYSLIDQAFNTQGVALRPALPSLGDMPSKGGGVAVR